MSHSNSKLKPNPQRPILNPPVMGHRRTGLFMAFSIYRTKILAKFLDVPFDVLCDVADNMDSHCQQSRLTNSDDPNFKERNVLCMNKRLRLIQHRIFTRLLLKQIEPSPYSYGGIRNRHIKLNAMQHVDSKYVITTDILNFYPSIHHSKVYKQFSKELGYTADVARMLTRLCTNDNHLALGLITSPLLANEIFKPVDYRIGKACDKQNLLYSRYMDDLTISGGYPLEPHRAGISRLMIEIVKQNGFEINFTKHKIGELSSGIHITKLSVNNGKIDILPDYINKLNQQIENARKLANGESFEGPFFTKDQLWGKQHYVCWINPSRKLKLKRTFNSIDWQSHKRNAEKLGLRPCKVKQVMLS